jgi:hypothetical protein
MKQRHRPSPTCWIPTMVTTCVSIRDVGYIRLFKWKNVSTCVIVVRCWTLSMLLSVSASTVLDSNVSDTFEVNECYYMCQGRRCWISTIFTACVSVCGVGYQHASDTFQVNECYCMCPCRHCWILTMLLTCVGVRGAGYISLFGYIENKFVWGFRL